MLDMGFSEDIKTIAAKLPKTCQTIMFSATMPEKIEELAKTLLKNPVEIKLAVSKPAREDTAESLRMLRDTEDGHHQGHLQSWRPAASHHLLRKQDEGKASGRITAA